MLIIQAGYMGPRRDSRRTANTTIFFLDRCHRDMHLSPITCLPVGAEFFYETLGRPKVFSQFEIIITVLVSSSDSLKYL